MASNPFKPTAGKMPPILIGRHSIIEDFSEALTNGVGAPGRIMLVTGQRGFGKTVMLTEFRRIAKAQHWEVIGETASAGACHETHSGIIAFGIAPGSGQHQSFHWNFRHCHGESRASALFCGIQSADVAQRVE